MAPGNLHKFHAPSPPSAAHELLFALAHCTFIPTVNNYSKARKPASLVPISALASKKF